MARESPVDADVFRTRLQSPEFKDISNNLSLTGLMIVPNNYDMVSAYECASGTDVASSNFTTMQSKLAAYKTRWKASLTTSLFVSMTDQNYDDVYAVYTGILGALFGAFALLVTTLFVYLVAALKRSFVC